MKICIYSGVIPSTRFIERLVIGLSNTRNQVFVIGKRKQTTNYERAQLRSYSGILELIAKILYNLFRLGYSKSKVIILEVNARTISFKDFLKVVFVYSEVVINNIDIFHVQWANDLDRWYPLKKFGVGVVVSLRGRLINTAPKANNYLRRIQSEYLPLYDGIHAVCYNILLNAERNFNHFYTLNRVIYSGINLEYFRFNTPKKSSSHLLLSVGRCNWIKGFNYSVDAFGKLLELGYLNLSYEIIGVEPKDNSEELFYNIYDKGLKSKIMLTPHLGEAELRLKMMSSHILIVPSVMEGIANVAIEAMAIGLLVVSSNVGGMSELIEDGVNGWLFGARDSEELAIKLQKILDLGDDELDIVRFNARKTIENKFNSSLMIANMLALYNEVYLRSEK